MSHIDDILWVEKWEKGLHFSIPTVLLLGGYVKT